MNETTSLVACALLCTLQAGCSETASVSPSAPTELAGVSPMVAEPALASVDQYWKLIKGLRVGRISTIRPDPLSPALAIVAGNAGAVWVDRQGQIQRQIQFATPARQNEYVAVVQLQEAGEACFIRYGGTMANCRIEAFNSTGRLAWTYDAPYENKGFRGVGWVFPLRAANSLGAVLVVGGYQDSRVFMLRPDGTLAGSQDWGCYTNAAYGIIARDVLGDVNQEILMGCGPNLVCRSADGKELLRIRLGKGKQSYVTLVRPSEFRSTETSTTLYTVAFYPGSPPGGETTEVTINRASQKVTTRPQQDGHFAVDTAVAMLGGEPVFCRFREGNQADAPFRAIVFDRKGNEIGTDHVPAKSAQFVVDLKTMAVDSGDQACAILVSEGEGLYYLRLECRRP